jgi:hypothetical protein
MCARERERERECVCEERVNRERRVTGEKRVNGEKSEWRESGREREGSGDSTACLEESLKSMAHRCLENLEACGTLKPLELVLWNLMLTLNYFAFIAD